MMSVWLKSIIKQLGLPVLWMAGSGILVLLTLTGFYALAPDKHEPPQPKFFVCLLLLFLFWIGWVALTISFNCWLNLKLTRHEPIACQSLAAQSNPFLSWPEQETASTEQYV